MTGILLCLAALAVLSAALWLVIAHPNRVAGWLYRLLHDDDPWSWKARLRARLLHIQHGDPYPPEAAEVPDPVDEHFNTARVVAGEDLDKDKRAIVNLALAAMLDADPSLAELNDLDSLSAYYVTPETNP